MASAPTPSLLPVINPTAAGSAAAGGGAGSDVPIATPAFRLLSRISESARHSLSDRRPWAEMVDRSAFSRPDSLFDATSRLHRNLTYFSMNYTAVVAFALGASLLAHPFSLLILLGVLSAWCFLYIFRASDQPVALFGRTFSDCETVLGLVVASIVAFFFTPVVSLIISGMLVGGAIVAARCALRMPEDRMPEDLFLDEADAGSGNSAAQGLLSFLGAPGSRV